MIILSIRPCLTSRVLVHAVHLTTWDLPALLPIREEGVLGIFIALKNPLPWPGFEPATALYKHGNKTSGFFKIRDFC
jgi:hypothetical protein